MLDRIYSILKSIISTWPLATRLVCFDWFGNYDTKIIGDFISQGCIPIPLFFSSWMTERFPWSQILILHNVYQNLSSDFLTQGVVWDWLEYTKIWLNSVIQYQKERSGEKKNIWIKFVEHYQITRFALNTQMQLFILPAGEMKSNCLTYIGLKIKCLYINCTYYK